MFRPVLRLAELWDGDLRPCVVAGRKVVVLRVGDEVRAYEDRCAHLGLPVSDGALDGCTLTCAAHHYVYDAVTGQGKNPRSVALRRYPLRIDGDTILVDVDADADGGGEGGDG
jgi:toluene monooxygenase system ferredoxin subunit